MRFMQISDDSTRLLKKVGVDKITTADLLTENMLLFFETLSKHKHRNRRGLITPLGHYRMFCSLYLVKAVCFLLFLQKMSNCVIFLDGLAYISFLDAHLSFIYIFIQNCAAYVCDYDTKWI